MAVEREHRRAEAAGPRQIVHEPEHSLMAEVHAVERTDRHRALSGFADDLGRIAVDPHDAPSVASTTAGFTPAPRRS